MAPSEDPKGNNINSVSKEERSEEELDGGLSEQVSRPSRGLERGRADRDQGAETSPPSRSPSSGRGFPRARKINLTRSTVVSQPPPPPPESEQQHAPLILVAQMPEGSGVISSTRIKLDEM